jgi:hypothetical protein
MQFGKRVSIYAFRGEGDELPTNGLKGHCMFQSTPSGGKATLGFVILNLIYEFQSTPSGGEGDRRQRDRPGHVHVSIHAFRGEGDQARSSAVSMRL